MTSSRSPLQVLLTAHALGRATLPTYASRFSRKAFTLPQLFACLALRQFYNLSYRRTEALLADCPNWREAIGMTGTPDHNTLCDAFTKLTQQPVVAEMFDRIAAGFEQAGLLGLDQKPLSIDSTVYESHHVSRHYEKRKGAEKGTFLIDSPVGPQYPAAVPRIARSSPGGCVFHVLNRGNGGQRLFDDADDYRAFLKVLRQGREVLAERDPAFGIELFSYCVMPNHWHLLLRPKGDRDLAEYMRWVGTTHAVRFHKHHRSHGHVYQGRFKSFPVQDDVHFRTVARYVEGNALRAGLTKKAEAWPWGSAHRSPVLPTDEWPVDRPERRAWLRILNGALTPAQEQALQTSLDRGRPFGDADWQQRTAEAHGLTQTMRNRGRPRVRLK